MSNSLICVKYAKVTLGKLVRAQAARQSDPRINVQNHKGKAKAYQVKQVLLAIEKLEVGHGVKK